MPYVPHVKRFAQILPCKAGHFTANMCVRWVLKCVLPMCVQRSNPATGGSKSGPGMSPKRSQAVPFAAKEICRDRQIAGFSIFPL
ncbi:hypothetical protein Desti_4980 [Desulfomonile tiedjei DSM 6799]|uniref:Uncharacterized protein n=1 Tax=Desulfomonile tiedjei (strain ATCC 49306 / DSM 6799 / DCB-1) TaxID=706587 RepID=I4CDF1_DESTA|nr:hypothetical protein Desti_4980 [Desulfomonile tiedjei DSM 6799]